MSHRLKRARPILLWGLWLSLAGCDDTYFSTAGTAGGGEQGWCGTTQIFNASCVSCHSPAGGIQGSLDLQTDPYTAIVDMPSALYDGVTLVVPGDSAASFLVAKLENTQGAGEGGLMPLIGPLQQAQIDVIVQWIDDGASDVCTSTTDTGTAQCDDTNEECNPSTCDAPESPTMLPGADCMACHAVGHPGEGPDFTIAGTAFTDLAGTELLSGATVHIVDADGNTLDLQTNAKGNFYTGVDVAMPYSASIEVDGTTLEMSAAQSTGACSSCHNCGGAAGGKLYGP